MQMWLQPLENLDVRIYCVVERRVNRVQYILQTTPGVGVHDNALPTFTPKQAVNRTKPTAVLFLKYSCIWYK